jgi:2-succinyl-5-enolpyruvyl-6-hydroxy-3-cyclohexene-1-carboxylate synthase
LPGHEETTVLIPILRLHCLTAQHLAKMYGLNYITASEVSLELGLTTMYAQNDKPVILEVLLQH